MSSKMPAAIPGVAGHAPGFSVFLVAGRSETFGRAAVSQEGAKEPSQRRVTIRKQPLHGDYAGHDIIRRSNSSEANMWLTSWWVPFGLFGFMRLEEKTIPIEWIREAWYGSESSFSRTKKDGKAKVANIGLPEINVLELR
jgi:hypothetical protein